LDKSNFSTADLSDLAIPAQDQTDPHADDGPELPPIVFESLASWRRIMRGPAADKTRAFAEAAKELLTLRDGQPAEIRQVIVDELRTMGLDAGLSDDEAQQIMAGKVQPEAPPIAPEVATAKPEPIVAVPYTWKNPETIRPREWLYGRRLVRSIVSATIAPGGVGKTSLEITETLAMVSGKPLLGITPPKPLRLWLWNLEDPREETERHIQATAKLYGLTPQDIGDRLFVNCAREKPLVIATTTRDKATIVRPVVDSLIEEIVRQRIDAVIVDPFVSCHEVTENDNSAMDMVAKEWGRIADLGHCAVELVHHVRKGEDEVTVESSRGGGALADACRTVRVLNRMTKDQAEKTGVHNHRLYFRTYSDKANLIPPADKSDWFKLESVDLCNGPPGESDLIGVVRQWQWPDAMAGITPDDFDKVAEAIRKGKWRESPQADARVGYAVADALGLNAAKTTNRAKIIAMLKAWIAAGSLIIIEAEDETRRKRKFVTVRD
jgi:hypothetical protein